MKKLFASLLVVLFASCLTTRLMADDKSAQPSQREHAQGQQMSPDQQYIARQASFASYQIEAAKLASQNAQDEQIKQFATDAQKSAQEQWAAIQQQPQWAQVQSAFQQLQQSDASQARLASAGEQGHQMMPTQRAMLAELQQVKGAEFDRLYACQQASIQAFSKLENKWAQKSAQQQQVKDYAQKYSESNQQQSDKINQIAESLTK